MPNSRDGREQHGRTQDSRARILATELLGKDKIETTLLSWQKVIEEDYSETALSFAPLNLRSALRETMRGMGVAGFFGTDLNVLQGFSLLTLQGSFWRNRDDTDVSLQGRGSTLASVEERLSKLGFDREALYVVRPKSPALLAPYVF